MSDALDVSAVMASVAQFLRLPPARLDAAAPLSSLLPSSFALVELVIRLQEEHRVRLVQEDLRGVVTVGDLARVVAERAAGR